MPEDVYPTPLHSQSYNTGPIYMKYTKYAKDWKEITLISTFEDKGVDTNESAANMPQKWTIEYDGLEEDDVQILDDFWNNHRLSIPFTFIEPRDRPWTGAEGLTVTGVKFEDYEDRDHDKVWIQRRVVHLIKYPS
jgi:hypothetical protein